MAGLVRGLRGRPEGRVAGIHDPARGSWGHRQSAQLRPAVPFYGFYRTTLVPQARSVRPAWPPGVFRQPPPSPSGAEASTCKLNLEILGIDAGKETC